MNIYLCRETYSPKGVCYGTNCTANDLSVRKKTLKDKIRIYIEEGKTLDMEYVTGTQTEVTAYITDGLKDYMEADVFILGETSDISCMLATPGCDNNYIDEAGWYSADDRIYAKLPLVNHCGLESFETVYTDSITTYTTPGSIGKTDGKLSLTFDDGGFTYHKTDLADTKLIPGMQVQVSYKMRGVGGYHPLAYFNFQTEIFTSAIFKGCGIVKKQKVYSNPVKPEDGYKYIYVPIEGGEGCTFEDEWSLSSDYRVLVEYQQKLYWLRSADFSPFSIGERVSVIKNAKSLPLTPSELDDSCVKDELSENNDMVCQELYYA